MHKWSVRSLTCVYIFALVSSEYQLQDSYIGATIGRNASRIAGSAFTLDGVTYKLAANSGGSHLHGGIRGFDKVGTEGGRSSRGPDVQEGRRILRRAFLSRTDAVA